MGGDWKYFQLQKKIDNIEDLLGEVLRRLGNMEYKGMVHYGEPNHISNHGKKYIHLELKRKEEDDS